MIIAGTGHRPNKLNNEYSHVGPLSNWLRDEVTKILLDKKPERVISGMALGFDTILALAALDCNVPLTAAIPFIGQEKAWPEPSQKLYNSILGDKGVDKYVVCEGCYAPWKMQKRNCWMVDNADLIIACYDGTAGGTRNCYNYAVRKQKEIVRINPTDFIYVPI